MYLQLLFMATKTQEKGETVPQMMHKILDALVQALNCVSSSGPFKEENQDMPKMTLLCRQVSVFKLIKWQW